MNKLRAIEIVGFRGARFKLPLDFTNKQKSISVYGENATGKSTITDALEWCLFVLLAMRVSSSNTTFSGRSEKN